MILKREFWKELPPKLHAIWEEVERLRKAGKELREGATDAIETLAQMARKLGEDEPTGFHCTPAVVAKAKEEISAESLKALMRYKSAASREEGTRILFWAEVEALIEVPLNVTVVQRPNGRYGLDEKYWVENPAASSRSAFAKLMEGLE